MAKTKVPGGYIADGSIAVAHLHSSHGITTDNIAQGSSNKYYTDAQVDTRLAASKSANFTTTGNIRATSDSSTISVGAGNDLRLSHNGTNSFVTTVTGDLILRTETDDGDIIFQTDDGSGGVKQYMRFDGGADVAVYAVKLKLGDSKNLVIGTNEDLQLVHNDSHSIIQTGAASTGDFYIKQLKDDADMLFQADNGSGGTTTYFFLDGSAGHTKFSANTMHTDSVNAIFGAGSDLKFFHDGSHSFVHHNGTGALKLKEGSADAIVNDGGVESINHSGSTKLATASGGISVTGAVTASTNLEAGSSSFLRFVAGSSTTPSILFGDSSGTGGTLSFKRNADSAVAMSIDAAGNLNAINGIRINGTEVISGGRNLTNIGTIASGAITATATSKVEATTGNNRGVSLSINGEIAQTSSIADWLHLQRYHEGRVAIGNNGNSFLYVKNYIDVVGGYRLNNTEIVDSSRNLTNIGTISSGNITAQGVISVTGDGSNAATLTETGAGLLTCLLYTSPSPRDS